MSSFFIKYPAIAVVLNDRDVSSLDKSQLQGADLIELRVDMFSAIDNVTEVFREARKKFALPLLATVRSTLEGGVREIKDRLPIYNEVSSFADILDIEIFSDEAKEIEKICKESGIKSILSYHNFIETPHFEELERIFSEGKLLKGDFIKIATMVQKNEDMEILLSFTIAHKRDNIIVIGMGAKGIPTRIVNPIFGSVITYAGLNIKSAPGQISLSDMVNIFRILGLR